MISVCHNVSCWNRAPRLDTSMLYILPGTLCSQIPLHTPEASLKQPKNGLNAERDRVLGMVGFAVVQLA